MKIRIDFDAISADAIHNAVQESCADCDVQAPDTVFPWGKKVKTKGFEYKQECTTVEVDVNPEFVVWICKAITKITKFFKPFMKNIIEPAIEWVEPIEEDETSDNDSVDNIVEE